MQKINKSDKEISFLKNLTMSGIDKKRNENVLVFLAFSVVYVIRDRLI